MSSVDSPCRIFQRPVMDIHPVVHFIPWKARIIRPYYTRQECGLDSYLVHDNVAPCATLSASPSSNACLDLACMDEHLIHLDFFKSDFLRSNSFYWYLLCLSLSLNLFLYMWTHNNNPFGCTWSPILFDLPDRSRVVRYAGKHCSYN